MRHVRSGTAAASLSLFLAAAALATAAPAAADDAVLTYEFRLGGFDVARAELALDLPDHREDAYRMRSALTAEGLIGSFTSFTSRSDASGRVSGVRALPEAFRTDSTWRGEDRLAALTWNGSAPPQAVVQPPPEADEREPVPPRLTVGSVDPLSAVLQLVTDAAADGTVDDPVTVFDGRRLYRLTVDTLEATRVDAPVFTGPGWRADIRYESLGGASRKWQSRGEAAAVATLAPGEAFGLDVPIPVRITVPLRGFGGLVVELVAARPGDA